MAQTCQMRPNKTISNWSTTFPTSVQRNIDSCTYMKKLLAVSISNILYLRGIFPDSSFCDRDIGGYNIKMLSETSKSLGTTEVIGWIKGCFDALDKKYLRQAIIGIYLDKNDPTKILESYTFKYNYHQNETTISVNDGTETTIPHKIDDEIIKKQTVNLLMRIENLTNNLEAIPPVSYLTMKLLYFDEVTPEQYEPPGFKCCSYNPFQFEGDIEPERTNIGNIATKHHTLALTAKTSWKVGNTDSNNNSSKRAKQSKQLMQNNQRDNTEKEKFDDITQVSLDIEEDDKDCDEIGDQILCVCGDVNNDGLMVGCENCKKWQHSECFGILSKEEMPAFHICDTCHDINDRECTDPIMMTLTSSKRKDLALYRRILRHCATMDVLKITINEIVRKLDVERYVAQNIMNLMEKENYLGKTKARKGVKKILKDEIEKDGYNKYFNQDYDISATPLCAAPSFAEKKSAYKRKSGMGDGNSTVGIADSLEVDNLVTQTESISLLDEKNNENEKNAAKKRKKVVSQSFLNQITEGSEDEVNENSNKRPKCSNSDKNVTV